MVSQASVQMQCLCVDLLMFNSLGAIRIAVFLIKIRRFFMQYLKYFEYPCVDISVGITYLRYTIYLGVQRYLQLV